MKRKVKIFLCREWSTRLVDPCDRNTMKTQQIYIIFNFNAFQV